jgi:DNA-directed RNA polymerase subunit RPC12/RpoP
MKTYNCEKHGPSPAHVNGQRNGRPKYRCSHCNNERLKQKHDELRLKAIHYKGARCLKCGYDKCFSAFDFHHRDPSQKEFHPSRGYRKSWPILQAELDKCDLLCANCHREFHELERAKGFEPSSPEWKSGALTS